MFFRGEGKHIQIFKFFAALVWSGDMTSSPSVKVARLGDMT